MRIRSVIGICSAALSMAACSEARLDPCGLLTVTEAKSLDSSVTISQWAGRGAEKSDNEVCLFYSQDGDPRVMLFVWYGNDASPRQLVEAGEEGPSATVSDIALASPDLRGAASFADDSLGLFAVQSDERTIGFRIRRPVRKESADFETLLQVSKSVLAR